MSNSDNKDLAEFFRQSRIQTPPIIMTKEHFEEILEVIDIRPRPSPALILAMDRARRMRESAQK